MSQLRTRIDSTQIGSNNQPVSGITVIIYISTKMDSCVFPNTESPPEELKNILKSKIMWLHCTNALREFIDSKDAKKMLNMKPLILYITFLLVIITVVPSYVTGAGSEYTYSFVHLSDTQDLYYVPQLVNLTFSEIESLKSQYNISAIFITGDVTDEFGGGAGTGAQFAQYAKAVTLTTIPVYEISGDHDVYAIGNYTTWDKYIPSGSTKHNYGFVFNDFIVYGFGWNDVTSLDPAAKTAMQFSLSRNTTKLPLILTHAYFAWGTWPSGNRDPIAYDILNALPRSSIILTGHQHNAVQNGLIRQTVYNNTIFIEDLINYQDWGAFSGGRLYNITSDGTRITGLTVSDLYLYPNFVVNNTVSYDFPPQSGVVAPVTGFSANVTSGTTPLAVGFTDSSTNTPTNWDWYWYANETKSSDLQNPTTALTTGTYAVRLYTSNSAGGDWENKTAYITVSSGVVAPVAGFSANVTSGTSPLAVGFTDSSTNTPTSWNWSFQNVTGNNTQVWWSTTRNPTQTFGVGNFSIKLNASNSAGYNITPGIYFINVSPSTTAGTTKLIVNASYNYNPDEYANENWATMRNAIGNDYTSTTNYLFGGFTQTYTTTPLYAAHWRAFVTWDTSSIPDTATITSAKVTLYGSSYGSFGAPNASIIDSFPTNPMSGAVQDYSRTTFTRQAADIPYASYTSSGMNNWSITNLSYVSKTGYTTYMFDDSLSVDNKSATWGSDKYGGFLYNSIQSSSGNKKPFLTIEYTLPSK